MNNRILSHFTEAAEVLHRFVGDSANFIKIEYGAEIISEALKSGHKIISCGNGGSHCDAMHFAEELSGRYKENRRPFAALAISDASHITCVGNDFGFEYIFSRFIEGIGSKGDVLFAISTSGNSGNILNACAAAREKEMKIIGLTGNDGGKLAKLVDVEIRVPFHGYADRIQEIHIKVIHCLIDSIEHNLL